MPQKKVGSSSVKVLLQNAKVRVAEMRVKPGARGDMKERPDRVQYIIRGGKIREHFSHGKTKNHNWKTGMARWQKKNISSTENIGKSEVRFITVQLKSPRKR